MWQTRRQYSLPDLQCRSTVRAQYCRLCLRDLQLGLYRHFRRHFRLSVILDMHDLQLRASPQQGHGCHRNGEMVCCATSLLPDAPVCNYFSVRFPW